MAEISKQALIVENNQSFPDNNSGAITPSDLRAFNVDLIDSTVNQAVYTTDSASWNNKISQLNAFTASQQPSFTALNSFTASQLGINAGVNLFTQSADGRLDITESEIDQLQNWSSSVNEIIVNGVTAGYSTRLFFNGFVSASIIPNVGGPIASITVLTDTTYTPSASFNAYTASTNAWTASAKVSINNLENTSASVNTSLSNINSLTASTINSLDALNTYTASNDARINTLSSLTGSYATTGSNTFRGDQTLIDAAGNTITFNDASGSLMLVAKGFTSSSAHLSASAAGIGNLIFKNNNTTADTIISGSANIFPNPTSATAGFKKYIGTSNYYTHGNSIPQISGSMAFSPTMNANIISNPFANAVTFRGPVSSSAYAFSGHILMGSSTISLGTSAANHFERAISGINMSGNALFNGALNMVANTTNLVSSVLASGNLIFGGSVTLNHISSSLSYNSNVTNGTTIINNRFLPSGSNAAILSPRANTNTIYGTGHAINFDGTNVSATQGKSFSFNILAGTFLTASVPDGDACVVNATGMIGNGLIVTGSTLPSSFAAPEFANSGQGGLFVGRFNALDSNKAKTAETIFAVGTGTSYTNRKTGFLIDSGSNTFVEGSLNVSGSTTISGSVYGNVVSASITSNTASIDLSVGNFFRLALPNGSITNINITNPRPGNTAIIEITNTGIPSASFSSNVKQQRFNTYAPTSGSNTVDLLSVISLSTSSVYVANSLNFV